MPRPYPPEFRARAIALVRARPSRPRSSSASVPSRCRSGCGRTTSTTGGDRGRRRASLHSCGLLACGSVSLKPSWGSSGRRRNSWARTSPAQKALPGDRPTRRCRGSGRQVLPHPGSRAAVLLQAQAHPQHAQAAAARVAGGPHPRGPRRLPRHPRLPQDPRRAHHCHGHPGLPADGLGPDDADRIHGLPGPTRVRRLRGVATAEDLVNRKFHRIRPNELWVTDITKHRTREGWLYCAAVLDAYSRRIVGWSIDSRQDSTLVVNALDMAIRNRDPADAS
jgi:transposase InsO family protein